MESQHRDLIREVRNGSFDKDGLKPFGHGIVTNRTFDEVVVEFLGANPELAQEKPTRSKSRKAKTKRSVERT
jgi:hypothetical protein